MRSRSPLERKCTRVGSVITNQPEKRNLIDLVGLCFQFFDTRHGLIRLVECVLVHLQYALGHLGGSEVLLEARASRRTHLVTKFAVGKQSLYRVGQLCRVSGSDRIPSL